MRGGEDVYDDQQWFTASRKRRRRGRGRGGANSQRKRRKGEGAVRPGSKGDGGIGGK